MADKTSNPPVERKRPTPWYGLPFVALGHLFWIWIILVVLEWFAPLWGQSTRQHAKHIFITQMLTLQSEQPSLSASVLAIIHAFSQHAQALLSIEFDGALSFTTTYWHGVVYVTLALLARMAMLALSWPLFILACFLGAFDGLIARQRRTAFVGRETETAHYYARKALPVITALTGYVWLLLPGLWPLSPTWLLLPGAVMIGLLVRTSVASYKKYL